MLGAPRVLRMFAGFSSDSSRLVLVLQILRSDWPGCAAFAALECYGRLGNVEQKCARTDEMHGVRNHGRDFSIFQAEDL